MNHEQVKQMVLQDPEVKKEYDALAPIYEIQEELIKLRNEKGLNQKQLAELIGTKQSAISRLESGNYNPSVQLLSKLAEAFNKELHIVFK
ncbi:MAG: helix-turn-helix domain-containing protein [Vallitaleaceae bacterium]|nr:helix-turn-helix domain-containing protein [Vallitaleaceae bacterium]